MQHAIRACCPDGALERVNLGSIHLMQHAICACCPDGALERVNLGSIHLMQHAIRACCPDGLKYNLGQLLFSTILPPERTRRKTLFRQPQRGGMFIEKQCFNILSPSGGSMRVWHDA